RYVNHRCSDHCKAQPSQAGFNAHEAPRPKFFLSIHHPGLGNSDGTRAATTLSPGVSNFPLSKRRLGNVRFFAPLVGGLSGRRSASSIVRRSTNVHCEQLFAPPARRPPPLAHPCCRRTSTSAPRPPGKVRSYCSLAATTVTASSQKLRAARISA